MPKKRFKPLDFSRVRTYPVTKRFSKVQTSLLGKKLTKGASMRAFLRGLPDILAAQNLKEIARKIAECHSKNRTVLLGMGAHPIKVGLSPLIIDFMERGIIDAIALNGAGVIHDFEIAYMGETSEDVAAALKDGSFGMGEETGSFINQAITDGSKNNLGIGAAVGLAINKHRLAHRKLSILSTAARLGIPVTSHIAIGTDIIHMHPESRRQSARRLQPAGLPHSHCGGRDSRTRHISQLRFRRGVTGSVFKSGQLGAQLGPSDSPSDDRQCRFSPALPAAHQRRQPPDHAWRQRL